MFAQGGLAQGVKDERGRPASLDTLVEVAARRKLHINCSGISSEGIPTVVLESAPGNDSRLGIECSQSGEIHAFALTTARALAAAIVPAPVPSYCHEDLHALLLNSKVTVLKS